MNSLERALWPECDIRNGKRYATFIIRPRSMVLAAAIGAGVGAVIGTSVPKMAAAFAANCVIRPLINRAVIALPIENRATVCREVNEVANLASIAALYALGLIGKSLAIAWAAFHITGFAIPKIRSAVQSYGSTHNWSAKKITIVKDAAAVTALAVTAIALYSFGLIGAVPATALFVARSFNALPGFLGSSNKPAERTEQQEMQPVASGSRSVEDVD